MTDIERLRALLAAATHCDECEGSGHSLQGWTDKNGYSEDQYGPCVRCSGVLDALPKGST